MSLVDHAEREIGLVGLDAKDSDYDGMIGKAVLELISVFAKQGHSGFSGYYTLDVFNEVARYKSLGPVTNNPEEWLHHETEGMWQNKRQGSLFSYDGGKTWHDADDPRWNKRTPQAWVWRKHWRRKIKRSGE